jgi:hypothetical protein
MSNFDDRDTAITRDPAAGGQMAPPQPYQQPYQPPQYYGYGMPYGHRMGYGMRGPGWSETKPFFLTSEFVGTLLCIIGVCVTAASARFLDAHGAALMSTILVAAYTVSRGIAKAGTRSHASDPRDNVRLGSHDGDGVSS